MMEALADDMGKASEARFGDHAAASIDGEGQVVVWDKKAINSEVKNTLTTVCCFNSLSLDPMGQSSFNANAAKSMSSGSGIANASFINEEYSSNGINSTSIAISLLSLLNSSTEMPVFFNISSQCKFWRKQF